MSNCNKCKHCFSLKKGLYCGQKGYYLEIHELQEMCDGFETKI